MRRSLGALLVAALSLTTPVLVHASELFVVTVRHEVADFAAWKKGFDADEASRQKAGVQTIYILRDNDKPNIVTVVHESANLDKLRTFIAEPSLKAKMKKSGVKGAPEVRIGAAARAAGR